MKLTAILTLTLLAVSVVSYGMPGTAHAQTQVTSDDIPEDQPPLSVTTESPTYEQGDTVTITGKIKTIDNTSPAVTMQIFGPTGNIVHIGQITPNEDGTYEETVQADGLLWIKGGEYGIKVTYASHSSQASFNFAGGEVEITCPPGQILDGDTCVDEEVEITCPPGQILDGDTCVDEEVEITCPPGQSLEDGKCVDDLPPPPECEPGQEVRGDECVDICGAGTMWENGQCVAEPRTVTPEPDNGCLIATAAYGSELAPQVQFLREIRDNTVMSTSSGASFMSAFNSAYYSFSPAVADLERESPAFREAVKLFITPMLSTLSIMTLADEGSESQVLGLGISVIALNLGLYIAAPAIVGIKVAGRLRFRI